MREKDAREEWVPSTEAPAPPEVPVEKRIDEMSKAWNDLIMTAVTEHLKAQQADPPEKSPLFEAFTALTQNPECQPFLRALEKVFAWRWQ